jgi:hypothetical protein
MQPGDSSDLNTVAPVVDFEAYLDAGANVPLPEVQNQLQFQLTVATFLRIPSPSHAPTFRVVPSPTTLRTGTALTC